MDPIGLGWPFSILYYYPKNLKTGRPWPLQVPRVFLHLEGPIMPSFSQEFPMGKPTLLRYRKITMQTCIFPCIFRLQHWQPERFCSIFASVLARKAMPWKGLCLHLWQFLSVPSWRGKGQIVAWMMQDGKNRRLLQMEWNRAPRNSWK